MLPSTLPAPFSATLSPALSVYLCMNVGPQGLLMLGLPAPFVQFICVRMWGRGVLPTALPALLSTTLSPAL